MTIPTSCIGGHWVTGRRCAVTTSTSRQVLGVPGGTGVRADHQLVILLSMLPVMVFTIYSTTLADTTAAIRSCRATR